MGPLEWIAVVVTALAVWLTTTRNRLCWPLGLVSVLLYAVVFYGARLYSDALLQGVYAVLECYGWWRWGRAPRVEDGAGARPRVEIPHRAQILVPVGLAGVLTVVLGSFTARYTDAALPWLDATLTAASLVAQYWMARLFRINWLLWIVVDVVYVGVYLVRGLPPTAALYAGFVVLAAIGWRRWK